MRRLALLALLAVIAAILPGAAGSTPARAQVTFDDVWSGVWPAQLMPGAEPLGTLTWREIREEEGRAMIGVGFGGREFEGCDAGPARFFRGHYVEGGDLIACTVGTDGRRLVGRFNGREDFRSGSFDVRIVKDAPRIFFGKYFEDDGVVTDWCGQLEPPKALTETGQPEAPKPGIAPDLARPRVKVTGWAGRAGSSVPLRAAVADNAPGALTVTFTVRRGARLLKTATVTAHPGAVARAAWRAPKSLRGALSVCATATDAAGNESSRGCATIRLR